MGITIATALAPIVFLIVLGYFLKHSRFLPVETWPGIEKLTYFILLPALLVKVISNQTITDTQWPLMFIVIAGTLLTSSSLLTIWFKTDRSIEGPTFTSIFQGGVRFNTYIALAVANSFYGEEGLALSAVAAGFMIIMINFLCISAFAIWGKAKTNGFKPFMKEILYNPLIISCIIGWTISLGNIELPTIMLDILGIIGRAALLLGLLAVGASLNLSAVKGHIKPIFASTTAQFFIKPLSVFTLLYFTGLNGVAAYVVTIFFMTPTASSACILARQLGGNVEVMSSIITFQTILAFLTMPLIAFLML
ncbi:MAG: AEC family transporter [Desulfobacterales bacterium]|nr:AEC family transporter [Desulfobacterales bacterium]MCP4160483.1 AEC family transporter [Deltaproteobacteria bacterium]